VMATPMPFTKMKEFYIHYDLKRFKNITMGRDVSYMLPPFYGVRTLPYLAFYDKSGNLIDAFEGSLPIEKVLEKFK
jgi:thioredoxin-related protein